VVEASELAATGSAIRIAAIANLLTPFAKPKQSTSRLKFRFTMFCEAEDEVHGPERPERDPDSSIISHFDACGPAQRLPANITPGLTG
jgi:hypothetical protein